MWLRRGLQFLMTQILPKACVFCGALSEGEEENICSGCFADLPRPTAVNVPLPAPFECLVTPLAYEFPVDVAIKSFKFRRKLSYAPAFAEILCATCVLLPDDIDAVVPVPLHWRREAFRGFNQAKEIANPVAKLLNVPIMRGLRRQNATPFQSGLAAKDRERNLRRAFAVRTPFSYEHVLIVDDVVTTGATARSLAKVLLRNGVRRVSVLAIARTTSLRGGEAEEATSARLLEY